MAAKENVKIAQISGFVSVITALITAFVTLYPAINKANGAASTAEVAATNASSSATSAEKSARVALAANPGAFAAHYRGVRPVVNASTARFEFTEKRFDPQGAVITGSDWRLKAPADAVYYVGVSYRLPYGANGASHITPYVSCTIDVVRRNTTVRETLGSAVTFTPSCAVNGAFHLDEGDQVYSMIGIAGAHPGDVTGDFYSVLIGSGRDGNSSAGTAAASPNK